PAVLVEADHALLDAGAGAVVEADHGRADAGGHVHDLVDLLGEHLTQGSAEHGEVLGEDEDLAAVDGAPAGDDAVGVGPLGEPAEPGPVTSEQVELDEAAVVEQVLGPLAGGHLAPLVLALDGALGPGVVRLFLALVEIVQALAERVIHDGRGYLATLPETVSPRARMRL